VRTLPQPQRMFMMPLPEGRSALPAAPKLHRQQQ
jgi:hypothetical protein